MNLQIILNCFIRLELILIFLYVYMFQLPSIMADNAGYDSAELVSQLRAIHTEGKQTWGISKCIVNKRKKIKSVFFIIQE